MQKYGFCFLNVMLLQIVCNAFRGQTWISHRMFVTYSLSVCYIIVIQKYGFCRVKVWFLACKKGVFALQKYGFCFLNATLLQIGSNAFRGWMWISHSIFATLFQFVSSVISSPQAAVGADLSCPHIRKYPKNGGQKCMYD